MHCQVPGIEYTMGKRAVQTMLEGATAIALSYSGVLYIAETDEKKIHRIRQVIFWHIHVLYIPEHQMNNFPNKSEVVVM